MGLFVFADHLSFGSVFKLVSPDFDFDSYPLISMKSGTLGVDDVSLCQLSIPMKVGAGCADVERSSIPFTKTSE